MSRKVPPLRETYICFLGAVIVGQFPKRGAMRYRILNIECENAFDLILGQKRLKPNLSFELLNFFPDRVLSLMADHVYVVDDDDRFRNSLCALIESVGLKVEGWRDPGELLSRPRLERPGCVVLDYRLPSLSGLEVLRLLRQKSSVPAILISAYADVQTAVAAMEMGAATVFEKPVDDNAFLNKLERFCFEDQKWVLKRSRCSLVKDELARLTETEREVLGQMRLGHSNKIIARILSKSVKAIERHRQNVVRKLNCSSAVEAILKVQRCSFHDQTPMTCSRDTCPMSIA